LWSCTAKSSTAVAPAPALASTATGLGEDTSLCCYSREIQRHRRSPRPLLTSSAGRLSDSNVGTADSPTDSSTLLVQESVLPVIGTGVEQW
jgi:hypothetical protein